MRIVFFNYTGDRDNWGCQATSQCLTRLLSASYPGSEVTCFELDPMEQWAKPFLELLFPIMSWLMRRRHPEKLTTVERKIVRMIGEMLYGERFRVIENADLALLQAEGSMFLYRGKTVRLFFGPYLSRMLGVPKVISLNQTVYSDDGRLDELIQSVFSCMDFVAAREPVSLRVLHSLGLGNSVFIPDAAFTTRGDDVDDLLSRLDLKKGFVAIGGSAQGDGQAADYCRMIEGISKLGKEAVFFAPTAPDRDLGRQVSKLTGIKVLDFSQYTYTQICGLLGHSSVLVTGRFHLGILAACAGTPIVLLGTNTHKNQGLADMLEWPFPILNVQETWHILEVVEVVFAQESELRAKLSAKVGCLAAAAEEGIVSLGEQIRTTTGH